MLGTDERPADARGLFGVFENSALESVVLPSTLRRIEYRVLRDCIGLKSIALPKGLEYIGRQCFEDSNLKEITLPKTVASIGDSALKCYSLQTVYVAEGCRDIVKGSVGDKVAVSVKSE